MNKTATMIADEVLEKNALSVLGVRNTLLRTDPKVLQSAMSAGRIPKTLAAAEKGGTGERERFLMARENRRFGMPHTDNLSDAERIIEDRYAKSIKTFPPYTFGLHR